ncbi:MAG: RNA polymerase sigma factor [bacterium]
MFGRAQGGQAGPLARRALERSGDRQLARLATRGHTAAFETIFRRYHQEVYQHCQAILGDPDDAQDALQGTMTAVVRSLSWEPREIALRPWLHRVAHNEAVSILRQRTALADPDSLPELATPGADSRAEEREGLRQLVVDLDALPPRQRGAMVMRELSGLSYAGIGNALNVSETGARQEVYEARLTLRELDEERRMECDDVRRALSGRAGRTLCGRRLRAHLRLCEGCRDFQTAIERRRSDVEAEIAEEIGASRGGRSAERQTHHGSSSSTSSRASGSVISNR